MLEVNEKKDFFWNRMTTKNFFISTQNNHNSFLDFQEIKSFNTTDELEAFMLKHGENIVDLMGGEIDRIEMKLRVKRIYLFFHTSLFSLNELNLILSLFSEKIPRSTTL